MTFDLKSFESFCRSKPADEEYDGWSLAADENGCALTQFFWSQGRNIDTDSKANRAWHAAHGCDVGWAAMSDPFTFGALADRLSKLSGDDR